MGTSGTKTLCGETRCDLMCNNKEGKEWLGEELWTTEKQGVGKYLMEGRYHTVIKVKTENLDGLERESEIKGYTVNEPGVRGGSLRKKISRKARYWQGWEKAWTKSQG